MFFEKVSTETKGLFVNLQVMGLIEKSSACRTCRQQSKDATLTRFGAEGVAPVPVKGRARSFVLDLDLMPVFSCNSLVLCGMTILFDVRAVSFGLDAYDAALGQLHLWMTGGAARRKLHALAFSCCARMADLEARPYGLVETSRVPLVNVPRAPCRGFLGAFSGTPLACCDFLAHVFASSARGRSGRSLLRSCRESPGARLPLRRRGV